MYNDLRSICCIGRFLAVDMADGLVGYHGQGWWLAPSGEDSGVFFRGNGVSGCKMDCLSDQLVQQRGTDRGSMALACLDEDEAGSF